MDDLLLPTRTLHPGLFHEDSGSLRSSMTSNSMTMTNVDAMMMSAAPGGCGGGGGRGGGSGVAPISMGSIGSIGSMGAPLSVAATRAARAYPRPFLRPTRDVFCH
jgi:hypothetical protein